MPETTMREPLDVVVRGKRSEVKALIAAWDERDAVADFPTAEPLIERLHTAVDPDARHEHEGGSDAHVMRGDARPPAGEGRMPREWSDEQIAERFHEAYERLAPSFGYETREASAKPWADVPEQNRALMTAVAAEVRAELLSSSPDEGERTAREALGEEAIEEIGAALVREGVAFDSHAPLEVVRMVLAHVPVPAPSSPSGESEREALRQLRAALDRHDALVERVARGGSALDVEIAACNAAILAASRAVAAAAPSSLSSGEVEKSSAPAVTQEDGEHDAGR